MAGSRDVSDLSRSLKMRLQVACQRVMESGKIDAPPKPDLASVIDDFLGDVPTSPHRLQSTRLRQQISMEKLLDPPSKDGSSKTRIISVSRSPAAETSKPGLKSPLLDSAVSTNNTRFERVQPPLSTMQTTHIVTDLRKSEDEQVAVEMMMIMSSPRSSVRSPQLHQTSLPGKDLSPSHTTLRSPLSRVNSPSSQQDATFYTPQGTSGLGVNQTDSFAHDDARSSPVQNNTTHSTGLGTPISPTSSQNTRLDKSPDRNPSIPQTPRQEDSFALAETGMTPITQSTARLGIKSPSDSPSLHNTFTQLQLQSPASPKKRRLEFNFS